MNLNEAARLFGCRREVLKAAIEKGVELPKSLDLIKLQASPVGNDYDIDEVDLDAFIEAFHQEEPGRHPPVRVRRTLLVEANHKCAICGDSTPRFQLHHMVEFAELKHYDPEHMLAICGSCHDKIGTGLIDYQMQVMYKKRLRERKPLPDDFPARFSWDDLHGVIMELHNNLAIADPSTESKYDFSSIDLEQKNKLNQLGEEYFAMMRDHHEPYFARIEEFLKAPINVLVADLYHQIVDELRSKVAASRAQFDSFETILMLIYDSAKNNPELKSKGKTLNILLSFMYFQCDIGRKI